MEKTRDKSKIIFSIDEEVKMTMDFVNDEFIWFFNSNDVITITKDMSLYYYLEYIMDQNYTFISRAPLRDYKDKNKLIWYSDCSYRPEDIWSISSVSYLTIERKKDRFELYPTKQLDKMVDRREKTHLIEFSTSNNRKYALNDNTGTTLQDDIITNVYKRMLERPKQKNKINS